MTGNIPELYDPANANGYVNNYPNSLFTEDGLTPEPSIRGRKFTYQLMRFFVIAVKWLYH